MRINAPVFDLMSERLNGLHGGDGFGGMRAGIGNSILTGARQTPHHAAKTNHRHNDYRQRERGKPAQCRTCVNQHNGGAEKHEQIAQGNRSGRTDHGFYQRGVGS